MEQEKRTLQTKFGYNMFEVISALQKEIRRGNEEQATYWAFELADSGFLTACLSRLRIIAQEDIGVGDYTAVLFATTCLNETKEWYPAKDAWRLSLGNAVIALCRATKSRDANCLQALVNYEKVNGNLIPIPDYAYCRHTFKGKRMGRGFAHFFDEGVKMSKDETNPKYAQEARRIYLELEAGKCKNFIFEPKKVDKKGQIEMELE